MFAATGVIVKGTRGEDAIKNELIMIKDLPAEFVPGNAITTTQALTGKIALFDLGNEMVIVEGMFVDP